MSGGGVELVLRKVECKGKDSDEMPSEGEAGLPEGGRFRRVRRGSTCVARRCRGLLRSPHQKQWRLYCKIVVSAILDPKSLFVVSNLLCQCWRSSNLAVC